MPGYVEDVGCLRGWSFFVERWDRLGGFFMEAVLDLLRGIVFLVPMGWATIVFVDGVDDVFNDDSRTV